MNEEQRKGLINEMTNIIEEVSAEICDNYCKYPAIYDTREDSDEEHDKMLKEVCDSCPLNRL